MGERERTEGSLAVPDILTSLSSSLTIPVVGPAHAGQYSCQLDSLTPALVTLHVIDKQDEHKLFMVNSEANTGPRPPDIAVLLVLCLS